MYCVAFKGCFFFYWLLKTEMHYSSEPEEKGWLAQWAWFGWEGRVQPTVTASPFTCAWIYGVSAHMKRRTRTLGAQSNNTLLSPGAETKIEIVKIYGGHLP